MAENAAGPCCFPAPSPFSRFLPAVAHQQTRVYRKGRTEPAATEKAGASYSFFYTDSFSGRNVARSFKSVLRRNVGTKICGTAVFQFHVPGTSLRPYIS